MEIPLLDDICIIFVLSIAVLFICHQIRLPAIVGFLLTGLIAGPHGLGLVKAVHEVEVLAEIGVVMLLFTIGIEFSLDNLMKIKRAVLLGGSLQVMFTLFATFGVARLLEQSVSESVFIGFLVSVSSTAIVLRLLQEQGETNAPYGRVALAILIFQDIIIVPMMLFTPLLAGEAGNVGTALLVLLAKGVGVILLVFISAKWLVPKALYQILRTRSTELFLLSILAICLTIVWLTGRIGLSLGLGAFLAGLIVSESEYGHDALGHISPFRDVFTSFFFVSIGMLLDPSFLHRQPFLIVLFTLGVLCLKAVITSAVTLLSGFSLRTAILAGLSLSQVGEFAFLLSKVGVKSGLLADWNYNLFLAVSILTMVATPFILNAAPHLADLLLRLPWPERLKSGFRPIQRVEHTHKGDDVIIIGFGVNGRNVARAARAAGIPYEILEMNPEIVREARATGEPIFYGDATHDVVLEHAGIRTARVVVVAISDAAATRRITMNARKLNPIVHLIVRTRYILEMKPLYDAGADEVIPEEFETSVEIFTRVLMKYLIPRTEIEQFVAEVRAGDYEMFRSLSKESASLSDLQLNLPDVEISVLQVGERSPIVGSTLTEIGLRKQYGVTLLAIRRDSQLLSNPHSETQFWANDVLYVIGAPDKIVQVAGLLKNPESEEMNHPVNQL